MRRSLIVLSSLALAACASAPSASTSATGTSGSISGTAKGSTSAAAASSGATGAAVTTSGSGSATASATTGGATATSTSGTGGSGTSTSGGSGGAVTVDTFASSINQAICLAEYTCAGAEPALTQASCASFDLFLYDALPAAVDAGRVAFDAAQAQGCVGAVLDAGCRFYGAFQSLCLSVVTGLAPGDAGCLGSFDCQSGVCLTGQAACSAGFCAASLPAGGACDCAGCGGCDPAGGLQCVNGTCAAPGALGANCGGALAGPCAAGLDCINGVCTSLPVSAGNACAPSGGDCVPGSYCLVPPGAVAGNCALQVALGQPCGEDLEHFANALAGPDQECAGGSDVVTCAGASSLLDGGFTGGVCQALSEVGGACVVPSASTDTTQLYETGCFRGLNCVSGTCARPPASGPCSPYQQPCDARSAFCQKATNTCQPYQPAGATCSTADSQPCGVSGACTAAGVCQDGPTCASAF